jgi:hypothetical protein
MQAWKSHASKAKTPTVLHTSMTFFARSPAGKHSAGVTLERRLLLQMRTLLCQDLGGTLECRLTFG